VLLLIVSPSLSAGDESPSGTGSCSAKEGSCSAVRSAHWVIRSSDLGKTLAFYREVLGMRVIRHEENPEPCPITCNGKFKAAWSKTMVGYQTEDISYCLEVTYNYGTTSYPVGTGLHSIALTVPEPEHALERAKELGYSVEKTTITGPDGYRMVVLPHQPERDEPFRYISLQVSNLAASTAFYTSTLGMVSTADVEPQSLPQRQHAVLGYPEAAVQQVPLVLVQAEAAVRIEQWEGRHAISVPEARLRAIYRGLQKRAPQLIVHEMQELQESLGLLVIAIIKDPDGYEICLVSSETFDKAVHAAADWKGPDWRLREKYHAERLQPNSTAAANPFKKGTS